MKIKTFWKLITTVALAACLCICPLFMGNTRANAEEAEIIENSVTDETNDDEKTEANASPEESENTPAEPPITDESGLKTLVEGFLAQLKERYGDDYETYYNGIIEQWDSIENYLLSLINEDTPDQIASGWTAFVKWLGEYSPVWASILAVALVLVVIIFGKKALNKVVNWATGANDRFKTLFAEINKIDAAQAAQNSALVKLLGENEKFKAEREALQESAEEMTGDGDKI